MQSSKIGLRKWLVAIYLMVTNLKGVSSRKLARDLGITQKSAWHMGHRIRKALEQGNPELLGGIVEVDETYIGGKERNKHEWKRQHRGKGPVGKTAVVGAVQRDGLTIAKIFAAVTRHEIKRFMERTVQPGIQVSTDEHRSYAGL